MPNTEQSLHKISQYTVDEITKTYPDMDLIGVGGSVSGEVINHETLAFNIYRKLSKIEGIRLIKEISDIYLDALHTEKGMSSYLKKYIFTHKNLKITLYPHTPDGDSVFHPDIAFFTLEEGVFYFTTINESRRGFVSREEVSYEEALLLANSDVK